MKKVVILLFIFIILLFLTPLFAKCVWEWDCSIGTCEHVPVCDSPTDIVPPEPPEVPPIAPTSIKPPKPPYIPPPGTEKCEQQYLCDNYGKCSWQEMCY